VSVTVAAFRKLALAMPEAIEAPHFDSASFRAKGKIFATLLESPGKATLKLMPEQQEMLTSAEPAIFQRVPNAWGHKGWTWMDLKAADRKTAESALAAAHANVIAKAPARNKAKRRA
jgi:predicted DNA-binding protein (MmcQ/YjbR family)